MKKWICAWLTAMIMLSVFCGAAGATEAAPFGAAGVVELLDAGASVDLDGDGVPEAIEYEILKDEEGYDTGYRLKVGEAEISEFGWSMNDKLYVLRLTERDPVMLLVSDYGPSDDYETHFYVYENGALIPAGTILSLPESMRVSDGIITAPIRGYVMYTWFHDADYSLAYGWNEDGTISYAIYQIPRYLYPMGLIVKLKTDLPLMGSMTNREIIATLTAGSEVVLCATDDREWVYVEALDGFESGWMRVGGEYGMDCAVGEKWLYSYEVFDGLVFAD